MSVLSIAWGGEQVLGRERWGAGALPARSQSWQHPPSPGQQWEFMLCITDH